LADFTFKRFEKFFSGCAQGIGANGDGCNGVDCIAKSLGFLFPKRSYHRWINHLGKDFLTEIFSGISFSGSGKGTDSKEEAAFLSTALTNLTVHTGANIFVRSTEVFTEADTGIRSR
jgi:hypothetical protein